MITRWGIVGIAGMILVGALLAGGVLYSEKLFPRKPQIQKPIVIPSGTADWKTYRNDKYGFEVKFPPLGARQFVAFTNNGKGFEFNFWSSQRNDFVSEYGFFLAENKEGSGLGKWFSKNVDYNDSLIKNRNFTLFESNGIQMFQLSSLPLPSEFLNSDSAAGGVAFYYVMPPSKKYVLELSISQDHDLYSYGYNSNEKIHELLKQIAATLKFN